MFEKQRFREWTTCSHLWAWRLSNEGVRAFFGLVLCALVDQRGDRMHSNNPDFILESLGFKFQCGHFLAFMMFEMIYDYLSLNFLFSKTKTKIISNHLRNERRSCNKWVSVNLLLFSSILAGGLWHKPRLFFFFPLSLFTGIKIFSQLEETELGPAYVAMLFSLSMQEWHFCSPVNHKNC